MNCEIHLVLILKYAIQVGQMCATIFMKVKSDQNICFRCAGVCNLGLKEIVKLRELSLVIKRAVPFVFLLGLILCFLFSMTCCQCSFEYKSVLIGRLNSLSQLPSREFTRVHLFLQLLNSVLLYPKQSILHALSFKGGSVSCVHKSSSKTRSKECSVER